jgi:hypothetical protein
MATLIDILFGCSHKNYSFPRTTSSGQRRSAAAAVTGTYVVCLDCGKEFPYDWQQMKIVASGSARAKVLAAKAAGAYAGEEEAA